MHASTSWKGREVSKNRDHIQSRGTDLLVVKVQELLELNATVRKGSEGPFFLELGGNSGVGSFSHGRYVECGSEAWMMWSEGGRDVPVNYTVDPTHGRQASPRS